MPSEGANTSNLKQKACQTDDNVDKDKVISTLMERVNLLQNQLVETQSVVKVLLQERQETSRSQASHSSRRSNNPFLPYIT